MAMVMPDVERWADESRAKDHDEERGNRESFGEGDDDHDDSGSYGCD